MLIILIYLILGLVIGVSFTWIIFALKLKSIKENQTAETDRDLAVINEKLTAKNNENGELLKRFSEIEAKLQQEQVKINDLISSKSGLEEKATLIPQLEEKLLKKETTNEQLLKEQASLEKQISQLKTLLDEERKQTEEKIKLLQEAKEQLKTEFENLANKIFDDKSQKFTEKNKSHLDAVINPFKEQLGNFRKKVEDVYDKESKDRVSLFNEIKNLKDINERISKDAINLTHALKGDKKAQGTWGEVVLERILEESGLHKGREYETQVGLRDEDGRLFKPDVIVKLPDNKQVIIDSKVSLIAYESYHSSTDEDSRKLHMNEHIQAFRNHIKGLSVKNYEDLVEINSLDYVLMFIPIEAAFLSAIGHDQKLFSDAFDKNIVLVSPSTLLVTLKTIQNIWQIEYQNQNAKEIAKKAGDLYDKFVNFVESLEDVGKHIDKAKESYMTAHNRLKSGAGNLINRVQSMKKLGVKSKKQLPQNIVEEAVQELPEGNTNK